MDNDLVLPALVASAMIKSADILEPIDLPMSKDAQKTVPIDPTKPPLKPLIDVKDLWRKGKQFYYGITNPFGVSSAEIQQLQKMDPITKALMYATTGAFTREVDPYKTKWLLGAAKATGTELSKERAAQGARLLQHFGEMEPAERAAAIKRYAGYSKHLAPVAGGGSILGHYASQAMKDPGKVWEKIQSEAGKFIDSPTKYWKALTPSKKWALGLGAAGLGAVLGGGYYLLKRLFGGGRRRRAAQPYYGRYAPMPYNVGGPTYRPVY